MNKTVILTVLVSDGKLGSDVRVPFEVAYSIPGSIVIENNAVYTLSPLGNLSLYTSNVDKLPIRVESF